MAKQKTNRAEKELIEVTPKNCYVGQIVYWTMWHDEEEGTHAWFRYKTGRKPEVWSGPIESFTARIITVEHYGKMNRDLWTCPQDAITSAYEIFCRHYLIGGSVMRRDSTMPLGEASVVFRDLADLEFNLHTADRHGLHMPKDHYYTTPPEEL